jgi:valyl-tRNA synthetase
LHPIMPFITEELWETLAEADKPLIHADWPTYGVDDLLDGAADAEMNWVIALIDSVRSARMQMHVPAGAHIPMVATEMDKKAVQAWSNNEAMILRLARIEALSRTPDMPKGCAAVPAEGATFGLPLADIIDISAEKERLEKVLGKLEKELGGLKGRLKNPKFVASAPEEVVEETTARLEQGTQEAVKLREALARLAEIA